MASRRDQHPASPPERIDAPRTETEALATTRPSVGVDQASASNTSIAFISTDHPHIATRSTHPSPSLSDAVDTAIATDYAGLFFLLNVAIALGMYGDDRDQSAIDPWQFLALVAEALIPDIEEDPVWTLLTHLSELVEPPDDLAELLETITASV